MLFIYLTVRGLSCGMQGLGPLHWEHRVLATGPPGKSQMTWVYTLPLPLPVVEPFVNCLAFLCLSFFIFNNPNAPLPALPPCLPGCGSHGPSQAPLVPPVSPEHPLLLGVPGSLSILEGVCLALPPSPSHPSTFTPGEGLLPLPQCAEPRGPRFCVRGPAGL